MPEQMNDEAPRNEYEREQRQKERAEWKREATRNEPKPHPSLEALNRFREKNQWTIEDALKRGDKTELRLLLSLAFNEGWHAALRHHGLKR